MNKLVDAENMSLVNNNDKLNFTLNQSEILAMVKAALLFPYEWVIVVVWDALVAILYGLKDIECSRFFQGIR